MGMDPVKSDREVPAGTPDEVSVNARDAPPGAGEGWILRDDREVGTEVSCSMLFSVSVRNVSTRVRHRGLEFREQLEESGPGLAS